MRVLQVSGLKSIGGGEQQLLLLSEEIKNNYPEIDNTIFCPTDSILEKEMSGSQINMVSASLNLKTSPRFFLKLGKYCKKQSIDIVHAHDPVAMFLVILASYFYKMPKCIYSKKTSFPIKKRRKTLYKYNHKLFKKIICVSNFVKTETKKAVTNHKKIVTIYDGIKIKNVEKANVIDLRKYLNLSDDFRIVLNIGNHSKPKDLTTFVKTANEVIKSENKIHFVQIGRFTAHTPPLQDMVKKYQIKEKVSFLGELKDASSLIPQANIFLHTAIQEGLGQVILEALWHQTPIVSTDVGGIPEMITNGENGLLSPEKDFKNLTQQIKSILNHKVDIDKLVENNKLLIQKKFSVSQMTKKTVALYKDILKE